MIEVGVAGSLGIVLGWMCAALLLAASALSGRVTWALAVRGARRGAWPAGLGAILLVGSLGFGVHHFATTPQQLEVGPTGDWIVYDAYGLVLERVPGDEVRQVRLTSDTFGAPLARLEVRRADGAVLVLRGRDLLERLGYAMNKCGAWADRPIWGPHAYSDLGPRCDDAPWPAALRGLDRAERYAQFAPDAL